jgi:DNA polymerase III subunit alpha
MAFGDHNAAETKLLKRERIGHGDHDAAGTKLPGHRHSSPPLVARRKPTGNLKPMRWVSTHGHTTFSYLDGYQLPEAHVRRATELQMSALSVTEHGNIDSHVKFEKAAEGTGVKPIFGCELYMPAPDNGKWWLNEKSQRKHHLTVLAATQEGYLNLIALVSKSWQNFYYEPTVSWDMLCEHKAGLVILSGCTGSLLFCSAVGGKEIAEEDASYKRALRVARKFKAEFGSSYFIEVQAFPELKNTRRFNSHFAGRLARAVGARLAGTMDVHYTHLEDAEVQQILHNLRPGEKRTLEEQAREWGYDVPLCPPPNDKSIWRRLCLSGLSKDEAVEAIVSTEEIAEGCNVTLPRLPMVRFPESVIRAHGFEDAKAYWRHQLKEGWRFRKFDKLPRPEREKAKRMLREEMQLIEGKDFVDYHLLVQAGIVHVKNHGVPVGPARGSAAASVACYLLRITEVNPLRFPFLRFDRYISVDREDLPDIDFDLPSEARPMLRKFYETMLGPGCVNNVGTFTQFKGRNSLDDVARVFHVPKPAVEDLKGYLIERSSGDMRASSTIEDTIEQFPVARDVWEKHPELGKAQLLEGNIKAVGIHAAGLILSREPITSVTSFMEKEVPKGSGNVIQAIPLDKKDAERQGLLKIDSLALDAMSMIWDAMRRLGKDLDWLYGLPLDDPGVYDLLQRGDFTGVFQFDGRANRYVGNAVKPEKFSEIMDCIALCRPGPLHNGGARMYADVKHGRARVEDQHPALAEITALTKGQIIYQEQVLDIMKIIGGFGKVAVSDARRIIAKKEGEQAFARLKGAFMDGAATLHERTDYPPITKPQREATFGDCITSGAYAFNAAHSAGYGLITNATAYLKVHYMSVFYAASLTRTVKDKDKTRWLLRDAGKHDVTVYPPSPKKSEAGWRPMKPYRRPRIQAGFEQIEGVGEKTAAAVVEYRERHGLDNWHDLVNVKNIGPKTIEKIEDWVKQDDPLGAFQLARDIEAVTEAILNGDLQGLPAPTHKAEDLPEGGGSISVTWLGTFVDRNIRDIFEQNRARKGEELRPDEVKDPHLNEWAQLTGEDDSDQLLIKIDRWKYPEVKEAIFDFRMGKDLLLIEGIRPRYASSRQIKVKNLYVIEP